MADTARGFMEIVLVVRAELVEEVASVAVTPVHGMESERKGFKQDPRIAVIENVASKQILFGQLGFCSRGGDNFVGWVTVVHSLLGETVVSKRRV